MLPHSKLGLLGPQRFEPNLAEVVERLGVRAPVAIVTAGWQEREAEDDELRDHLGIEMRNLRVWERVEELFEADPELLRGMRERFDALRRMQELYDLRLAHALEAARELCARSEPPALLDPELEDAILAVRALDEHHLARVADVQAEYEASWKLDEREGVQRLRAVIARELGECEALCIAGGHVAVLLNRMRLLDVLGGWDERPLIGWAAGAMVLCERVVLFHDSPAQGPGNAEVFSRGFALCPDVVALPHASRRLRLDDPVRVSLLARRFAPARCSALDPDTGLLFHSGAWDPLSGTRELLVDGSVAEVTVA